ncbi:MAG: hypothetical protein ACPGXK_17255 [Phycisphaerae bacterium]
MVTYVLLESLLWLTVSWVGVQVVLIAIWSSMRSPLSARVVWVGFLVGPVLFIVSHWVETRREAVIQVSRNLARSVADENISAFSYLISSDFEAGVGVGQTWYKAEMVDFAERCFSQYDVYYPELYSFDIVCDGGDSCRCEFSVNCRVEMPQFGSRYIPTRWALQMEYADRRWQILEVASVPVPPLNIRSMDRIGR